VYIGLLAPDAVAMFSRDGVYVPYLVPDYAPPPAAAVALYAVFWLLCLALLLGAACGWTIPALLAVYLYHYFLALGVKHSSFERLILVYLLVLAPSQCDSVWSLTAWFRRRKLEPTPPTFRFAGRVARFQTIILYGGAGLWKLFNPDWTGGALLYCTMQGIWATPLAFAIVRLGFGETAWQAASLGVIGGELLVSVLLLFRRTRLFGVALGTLFHVMNSVILAIPEFLVCIAPYPLFLPERSLERLNASIAGRFQRGRSNQAT
jgi:hypothetical protein